MRLIHYLRAHWNPVKAGGVQRFSYYFQKTFPRVINVTAGQEWRWKPEDVCVTDNDLCLDVPEYVPCAVAHHGTAPTHFDRDIHWRDAGQKAMKQRQIEMWRRPKTLWIAPSRWVYDEFTPYAEKCGVTPLNRTIIPHWVPLIGQRKHAVKPVIIGDWRDWNKGSGHWKELTALVSEAVFKPLQFEAGNGKARNLFYADASIYLCLSLSEGGSYSLADAEAARLKIVTTRVGQCYEYLSDGLYFLEKRDDLSAVANTIKKAMKQPRTMSSFYESFTQEKWRARWQAALEQTVKL